MDAENDPTGTRGGLGAAPENETSNSEAPSDSEDIREEQCLIPDKLDGSLGGTPLGQLNAAEDGGVDGEGQRRQAARRRGCCSNSVTDFVRDVYSKYDPTFVTMLCAQYFNQGFKVLVSLATADAFKTVYKLEPGEIQKIQAIIGFPWVIKIVYGLISDNIAIAGSKRKSYLLIAALLQFLSMTVLVNNNANDVNVAVVCLSLGSLSVAFSDVIVDALMCIQARRHPDGAEDLQTMSWCCLSIGGLAGSVVAAFLTENYDPSYCFQVTALFGLVIAVVASMLHVSLETEGLMVDVDGHRSFGADLCRYMSEIGQAFTIPEIYCMILYLLLYGLVVPSFSSFGYFFMLDVVELSKFTYSMLTVLGFFCLLIGSALYTKYFKNYEFRSLILMEMVVGLVFAPFSYMFVLRLNVQYGIPDLALIIFTDTVQDIVSQCFVFLPMAVMFAKITPRRIEATSFALLAGVSNFRATIRGWTGSWINDRFVGVSREDLTDYWVLVTIGFVCSFIPLLFLRLIPTRQQIDKLQEAMQEDNEKEKLDKNSDGGKSTDSSTELPKIDAHQEAHLDREAKP